MTTTPERLSYAEDLPVGVPIDLGFHTVTADEIIAFATAWDPQRFHLDPVFAATTLFGGLIASGVHTLGIYQRLAVRGAYRDWRVIAGRTLREIQLPAPVRPGMSLHGTLLVEDVRHVRPDRSLVTQRGRLRDGERAVLELVCDAYVARRGH